LLVAIGAWDVDDHSLRFAVFCLLDYRKCAEEVLKDVSENGGLSGFDSILGQKDEKFAENRLDLSWRGDFGQLAEKGRCKIGVGRRWRASPGVIQTEWCGFRCNLEPAAAAITKTVTAAARGVGKTLVGRKRIGWGGYQAGVGYRCSCGCLHVRSFLELAPSLE
jgi:hypothetical protein